MILVWKPMAPGVSSMFTAGGCGSSGCEWVCVSGVW